MIDGPTPTPTATSLLRRLSAAVEHAVVEADETLRLLAIAIVAGGHAVIEDVPGTGKTLVAKAFARALDLSFARVQGTPDLLPSDITGSSVLDEGRLRYVPGPIFANVLLVDEINRATPRTQSALLEAMQEGQVSAEGTTRPLPDPFIVLATQNPIEVEGTFALPEAQLDRFLVRVRVGYPSEMGERTIARRYVAAAEPLDTISPVISRADLLTVRDQARAVRVADDVELYLVRLIRASRERSEFRLGASPRASVALYRAAQARALLDGRDFVRPDDVAAMAPAVLAHRLILDPELELRGVSADTVLRDIITSLELPMPRVP